MENDKYKKNSLANWLHNVYAYQCWGAEGKRA
jgi:hypothetical protein